MALDVAILAQNGQPETSVPIGANEHTRLLSIAEEASFPLLHRLRDYYQDAEYDLEELDLLAAELNSMALRVQTPDPLARLVAQLTELVRTAKRLGKPVVAIAD